MTEEQFTENAIFAVCGVCIAVAGVLAFLAGSIELVIACTGVVIMLVALKLTLRDETKNKAKEWLEG